MAHLENVEVVHVELDRVYDELRKEKDAEESDQNFDLGAWRNSRERAFAMVESKLSEDEGKTRFILVDDNFYYQSMRHTFFRVARKRRTWEMTNLL